jgi:DNA-directed RNA polymerase beta' subunit
MLVADMMTTTGDVQQIGRHGISGKKASVLLAPHSKSQFPTLLKQPLKVKVILWLE